MKRFLDLMLRKTSRFSKRLMALVGGGLLCLTAYSAEIWVSPQGDDTSQGDRFSPKASLHAALRQAREIRRLHQADGDTAVVIILMDGHYFLDETLFIRPEDSGSEHCPTIIRAQHPGRAIVSGGKPLNQWKRSRQPQIWECNVPKVAGRRIDFRQVYVNGKKALKACDREDPHQLQRILAVEKEQQTIRIPRPEVSSFANPHQLEFFIHQMWEVAILRVKDIQYEGETALLSFQSPESRIEFEHPWPPAVISEENGNSVFRLSGAKEFLDHEGEWYYDHDKGKLYYYARPSEDMRQAEVIVPILETLVDVQGSLDSPVSHLRFEGLTFSHSSWMRPSTMGYVPLQAGMFLLDAYKLPIAGTPLKESLENQAWIGRQPAAVQLYGVQHTAFVACRFEHLGASGLDYLAGNSMDRIEGCRFSDIAGSGLVIGKFSDPGIETHLPYQPSDLREVSQCMHISNNYLYDCANEYWGCVGILAGYVRDLRIAHNELCELPYSGISVGWGWTSRHNCMKDNFIVANEVHRFGRHNYSCGGIYTLSAQPGTVIAENYVHEIYHPDYVHDKTQGHYIYLDEASSWMTIRDNWCSEAKFGQNQPGLNQWENNGPQVADSIRQKAGLEAHWQHIKE